MRKCEKQFSLPFKVLLLSDHLVLQDKGIIAQCSVKHHVPFLAGVNQNILFFKEKTYILIIQKGFLLARSL